MLNCDSDKSFLGFEYCYRDAANFKSFNTVVLRGFLSNAEQAEICNLMESGEFFIAEQIGLPPLYEPLYKFSGGITAEDHCWHNFIRFIENELEFDTREVWGPAKTLVRNFRAVCTWDARLSPHFLISSP